MEQTARLTAQVSTTGAKKAKEEINDLAGAAGNAENKTHQLNDEIKNLKAANDKSIASINNLKTKLTKLENQAGKTGKKLKSSFGQDLSRSIAAIDGPLGGISSRISALNGIAGAGGAAGAIGVLVAGVAALGVATVQGIANLDEYEVNMKRLTATIKANGEAVGFNAKQMQLQAETLAIATLTSVNEVQKAQAKLVTFNRVLGDEFDRTIKASQDLAEAGFGTIESNAVTLGKALQDPITGMSALTRVGITLSENQKQLAKDAVAVGDIFEAQRIVLNAVEGQVKGTAEAVASGTLAGIADSTGIAWERLTRKIAEQSDALYFWKRVVKGAGIAADLLSDKLSDESSAELFTKSLELSEQLIQEQNKLGNIVNKNSFEYKRQEEIVRAVGAATADYQNQARQAAKTESVGIKARADAQRKEIAARKEITAQLKKESTEKLALVVDEAAREIEIAKAKDAQLAELKKAAAEREKQTALSYFENIAAANDTELEAIQRNYDEKLAKLDEYLKADADLKAQYDSAVLELEITKQAQIKDLTKDSDDEIIDSKKTFTNDQISLANTVTQGLGAALGEENELYRAAATTSATISAIDATQAAFAWGNKINPVAGIAAATAAGIIGASNVAQIASAREQGGQTFSGQTIMAGERGTELITTRQNAAVINSSKTSDILDGIGKGGGVNLTVIDQSDGSKEYTTEESSEGEMILLIRNTVAGDAVNPNSEIHRSLTAGLETNTRYG